MFYKNKKKGFSTLLGGLTMICILIIFFMLTFYLKCIETVNLNLKDDADMATMAAATIDLDQYGTDHKNLYCVSSSSSFSNAALSNEEKTAFKNHFTEYADNLVTTMGLNENGFDKNGSGNISWAVNALGAKNFKLSVFEIYDYNRVNNKWIRYSVQNINPNILYSRSLDDSAITKTILSSSDVSKDPVTNKTILTTSNGKKITATYNVPTVHAVFSFTLKLPIFLGNEGFFDSETTKNLSVNSISQVEER